MNKQWLLGLGVGLGTAICGFVLLDGKGANASVSYAQFHDGTRIEAVDHPNPGSWKVSILQIKQSDGRICYAAIPNVSGSSMSCINP